jgi:prenyltransferase/squalene oxidase-like repeat protein
LMRGNPRPPPAPPVGGPHAETELSPEPRAAEIDHAVACGLKWLADNQEPCGGWVGDAGHKQEDGYAVYHTAQECRDDGGAFMGVSALAGLAFLADGKLPDRGPYSELLDKIIDYVVRHQNEFGYFCDGGSRMYSHSFAVLFLSQAHGMCNRRAKDVERALTAAVQFLQDSQNERGAWRYQPFTVESDLSVTVCQVQALRAARDAGIPVASDTIDRVVAYVRSSKITDEEDEVGLFHYKIYGRGARRTTSFAINAAAVTTLHSAGLYDEREYGRALDYVAEEYPRVSARYADHYYFWYGNYYAAQALFTEGGPRWKAYWTRLRDDLLKRQQSDGRWLDSVGPGDAFSTAVACLLLRLPAQYLPIFQR